MDITKEVFPQGVGSALELAYGSALYKHLRHSFTGAFFYDEDLDAYWRLKDYKHIKVISKKKIPYFSNRYFFKFLMNGIVKRLTSDSPLNTNHRLKFFFYPSRNGVVIIDLREKVVTKIITPLESEPDFLVNETNAYKCLPGHVPKVIKSKVINNQYFYLCSEYLEHEKPITWKEWPIFLKKMIPDLFEYYEMSGITVETVNDSLRSLEKDMSHYHSKKYSYLKEELSHIYVLFLRILKQLEVKSLHLKVLKTRVHGDLTPNNIIINNGRYYIYDWANGGQFNIFYDLMIQEFYNPDSAFWKRFMTLDHDLIEKSFYQASTDFINRVEKLTKKELSIKLFQFSILVSLLELSFKNFYNYQFCDLPSGKRMLGDVIRILKNIEG